MLGKNYVSGVPEFSARKDVGERERESGVAVLGGFCCHEKRWNFHMLVI